MNAHNYTGSTDPVQVNSQDAIRYVRTIFEDHDLVELRLIGAGRPFQNWLTASQLASENTIADIAKRVSDPLRNAYVGANPRSGRGGSASDVKLARCLFTDFDGIDEREARQRIEDANLPAPTLLVNSGHGIHSYWRLSEAMTDLSLWSRYQRSLIAVVSSDPSIHDPPRIIRWPGFANVKASPVATSIIECEPDRIYDLGEFPTPLPEARRESPARAQGERGRLRNSTLSFIVEGVKEGERNKRLFEAACELIGAGYSRDEARERLWIGSRACRPPLDQAEFNATLASAFAKPRTPWTDQVDIQVGGWNHYTSTSEHPPKLRGKVVA